MAMWTDFASQGQRRRFIRMGPYKVEEDWTEEPTVVLTPEETREIRRRIRNESGEGE